MRTVVAAVAIALMTVVFALHATSSAAGKGKGHHGEAGMKAPAKKVDDKAYKAAIDSLPDKKLDPWRQLR